jgi:site-specific recombinase XerD
MTTAWRDFERVARKHGTKTPAEVTPRIAREFVEEMKARGLVADTANDRLSKVKHVYNLAVGALLVTANPAEKTIGMGKSALDKRRKKRLPWSQGDLLKVYASPVYDGHHLRSQGNAGEATYWIPLVMYYSGMRPEEVAGLAASDIVDDGIGGHYFDVIDRPYKEDFELFEGLRDDEVTSRPRTASAISVSALNKVDPRFVHGL